jgi:hypothetical protein
MAYHILPPRRPKRNLSNSLDSVRKKQFTFSVVWLYLVRGPIVWITVMVQDSSLGGPL